jgi:hypothetical protein
MGTTFRAAADDTTIAVTVQATYNGGPPAGHFTVIDSQLVAVDGDVNPFPCDGAVEAGPPSTATCAAPHVGAVELSGPAVVGFVPETVCNVITGDCISDLCDVVDCSAGGTCVSPGTCRCDAHGRVGVTTYVDPWTGPGCQVPPTGKECCSTPHGCNSGMARRPNQNGCPCYDCQGVNNCGCSSCDLSC